MIIPMEKGHRAFCASSWIRSYQDSPYRHATTSFEAYKNKYLPVIDGLLDNERTLLAVLPEDTDEILGFICLGEGIHANRLHYLYVKSFARNTKKHPNPPNIAKNLLKEAGLLAGPIQITFRSRSWDRFAEKHGIDYRFDASPVLKKGK